MDNLSGWQLHLLRTQLNTGHGFGGLGAAPIHVFVWA